MVVYHMNTIWMLDMLNQVKIGPHLDSYFCVLEVIMVSKIKFQFEKLFKYLKCIYL